MKKKFNILIADKNPHVRDFLKREMTAEGCQVQLAESGREVLRRVYWDEYLDLLIMDPDLPDIDENALLQKIQNRLPHLPVIIHTFFSDYTISKNFSAVIAVVEKGGSSVEQLKTAVYDILNRSASKDYLKQDYKIENPVS